MGELYHTTTYKGFYISTYKVLEEYEEGLYYCVVKEIEDQGDDLEYTTDKLELHAALNKASSVIDTLSWYREHNK